MLNYGAPQDRHSSFGYRQGKRMHFQSAFEYANPDWIVFHLISLVSRKVSNWSWSCKMTRQVTAEKYNLIIFMTQVKYLFPLQLTEATSHARWCWARTYLANLPSEVSPMPTVATWRGFPFLFAQIENRKCMEHSQELFAFPGWEFAFISTRFMSIFQVA